MNSFLENLRPGAYDFSLWHLAGWTMCYFLAVGTLVALAGALVRFLCQRAASTIRYTISLAVFTTLALLPIAIAAWLIPTAPPIMANLQPTTPNAIDLPQTNIVRPSGRKITPPLPSRVVAETFRPEGGAMYREALRRGVEFMPWLWIFGAPITFTLLATGLVGSTRLRRNNELITTGTFTDSCLHLRKSLNISRQVSVATCNRIAQPVLVGIVRPLILFPPAALTGWSPDELEMVLLHELAHVRRWDNLINLLQRIVESLLFFHPAVWLVSRQVRRDREECCDAVVVAHTSKPQAYAELLVTIAASPSPLTGLALARHPLIRRIRRILKLEDEPMLVSRNTLGIFTLATVALIAVVLWRPTKTIIAEERDATVAQEEVTAQDPESAKAASIRTPEIDDNRPLTAPRRYSISRPYPTPRKAVLLPGDLLYLEVIGTLPEHPITGNYAIGSTGTLALGAAYGRVNVADKTLLEAEIAVTKHLSTIILDPKVQLQIVHQFPPQMSSQDLPKIPTPFQQVPPTVTYNTRDHTSVLPQSETDKSSLRYEGKTFEQWRKSWKTELSIDRRLETVRAMAAFGSAGRGKEAAEVILGIAGQYDWRSVGNLATSTGRLQKACLGAFYGNETIAHIAHRIPKEDAIAVLLAAGKSKNVRLRAFLMKVLPVFTPHYEELRKVRIQLQEDEELKKYLSPGGVGAGSGGGGRGDGGDGRGAF